VPRTGPLLAALVVVAAALVVAAGPARAGGVKPSDRREINAVVDRFIRTAVRRDHPAAAWNLVTPRVRAGTTRRDWARGNLPVYPYPARGRTFHGWQLSSVDRNDVTIDLTLQPARRVRKRVGAIAFAVELKRVRGRWLVDSFNPEATFAPEGAPAAVVGPVDFSSSGEAETGEPLLGGMWWLVVIGVFMLAPLVGIAALVVSVRQGRWSGTLRRGRASLPPLPTRIRGRSTAGK
jgi:hypothetical protein